jgi:glutaminyl-tRNA synthetase
MNARDASLAELFSAVPKTNRYPQTPEALAAHEAATGGKPLTRFPPEPNGFLHIGHAKSCFLNFNYARIYGGQTYLRYDDTNPSAEREEFVDSIKEDVAWLGHSPFKTTYTSDYFQRLYECAEDLTRRGLCYADNQTAAEVSEYREKMLNPPCRDTLTSEQSLAILRKMREGRYAEGEWTLRMKMDMQNANPCLRDPIAYRIKYLPHGRTGDEWCIYPSYDFSHCLIDAFENITHSMCTLEFEVRRDSYDWLTKAVGGFRPMQWEFSRLNVTKTVMSKRKINAMVAAGLITGYDDPRMFTLAGLRRRGYTPSAINHFVELLGISRANSIISLSLLEHVQRQELDADAVRAFGVREPLRLVLTDFGTFPGEEAGMTVEVPNHPKKPEMGARREPFGPVLFIERSDFREVDSKKYFGLAPGKTVGLRFGPNVTVQEVVKDDSGAVVELRCTHDPARAVKAKGNIHWVAEGAPRATIRVYSNAFTADDVSSLGDKWLEDFQHDSLIVYDGYVQESLRNAPVQSRYQFERVGYFVVDQDSYKVDAAGVAGPIVVNQIVSLREASDKAAGV